METKNKRVQLIDGAEFDTTYINDDLLPLWMCRKCEHVHGQDRSECNNCYEPKVK